MVPTKKNQIKIPWKQKLWFRFEDTLSKGSIAIIFWLTVLTILLSLFFGIIIVIITSNLSDAQGDLNLIEAFWQSFLHIIDTGAISTDEEWAYRIIALFSTLIGVLIFSTLIGVLTTGLDNVFLTIRKGKSQIILSEFTLILGWSPTIFKIISELILANANHRGKNIVILAPKDKIEMEDEIQLKINQKELIKKTYHNPASDANKKRTIHHHTKIVCRTGNPVDLRDLKMVHPSRAKSIIILPTDDKNSDTTIIKCILALESQNITAPIVSEIKDNHNREAVKFCFVNKNKNKFYIPATEWLSKVTAQTSQQPGYSIILTELLNYETNEIYIQEVPQELYGRHFEAALVSCTSSIILGIIKKQLDNNGLRISDTEGNKNLILNPLVKCIPESSNLIFDEGDKLILLQLDDKVKLEFNDLDYKITPSPNKPLKFEECKILILGWNERIYVIIEELFEYISKTSKVLIIADIPNEEELLEKIKTNPKLKNLNIKLSGGDTTDYKVIEKWKIQEFSSIIILGYDHIGIQEKDGKSILTILHIRQILKDIDKNIVAEIYDEKNREIVELSKACDYIIGENIISSMMTQLSEQEELFWIFEELFDAKGCEIYLKPIGDYIDDFKSEYNFYELLRSAANKNEIAIGYREMIYSQNMKYNYGVSINPVKDKKIKFSDDDKIVVIGRND